MFVRTAFETLLDAALALPPEKRAVPLERLQESLPKEVMKEFAPL